MANELLLEEKITPLFDEKNNRFYQQRRSKKIL